MIDYRIKTSLCIVPICPFFILCLIDYLIVHVVYYGLWVAGYMVYAICYIQCVLDIIDLFYFILYIAYNMLYTTIAYMFYVICHVIYHVLHSTSYIIYYFV